MRSPLALVLLLAACVAQDAGQAAPERRPNVIVVLADDLGSGDLGCANPGSKIPTPNLDRLATQGIRLTDAHSPSGVCTPTRYGLLTGRYAWRSRMKRGVLNGYSPLLIEPGRPTLATVLGSQGYTTAAIGKWHLGLGTAERTDYAAPLEPGPLECGFDQFFGIPASLDMPPYLFVRDHAPEQAPTETVEQSGHRRQEGGGFWRAGPIAPDFAHADVQPRLIAEAQAFLEEQATADEPFFLYLPLAAPHTPWLPSPEFRGRSEAGFYGDFVAMVDDSIGTLMETLDQLGLAENTVLVVTSDNGSHWPRSDVERYGHEANLGFRGQKADVWEGGNRIPFLARWPGHFPAGAVADELVGLTDLYRTLGGLGGSLTPSAIPGGEDSQDVLSVLEGRGGGRESLVLHAMNGMFALRLGSWKFIDGLGSGGFSEPRRPEPEPNGPTGQLYDLAVDPAEARNLFLEEPNRVALMRAELELIRSSGRSNQG